MSILVLQVTIKQWDKSQRTDSHIEARAKIPTQYLLAFPPAVYVANDQCIIDPHGDDILGNRISYSQTDDGKMIFDRFQVCLSKATLDYLGEEKTNNSAVSLGSLEDNWTQCNYDWRYRVEEGGFIYWLYEEVTLNAISLNSLDENVFLNAEPSHIYKLTS